MDAQLAGRLQQEWNKALSTLEVVLEDRPGELCGDVAEAMHSLVRARDHLIAALRADREGAGPESARHLQRINAMLSVVASLEYPLAGLHWDRMTLVRDGLREMLRDAGAVG